MDPFVGEIRPFAFPYAPRNWASCNGQTLLIRQYTALFALLGTAFGGDGQQTFGLPNLNGQLAVGTGQSPGNSSWTLGQVRGSPTETLSSSEMAAHNHNLEATLNGASSLSAAGNQPALASVGDMEGSTDALIYVAATPTAQLANNSLATVGSGQAHGNMMPTQVVNFCIALQGTFPTFP